MQYKQPDLPEWAENHGDENVAILAEIERLQKELAEREMVIGEAYQVVGSLLADVGEFESEEADKVLTNLASMRQVHDDVLPWKRYCLD